MGIRAAQIDERGNVVRLQKRPEKPGPGLRRGYRYDVHVGRLRKALNRGREADPIRTVRGAGYALDDRFGRSAA